MKPSVKPVKMLTGLILTVLLTSCTFQINYDRYAVVYGISDYPDSNNDLSYCDADALAMEALLTDQGFTVITRTNAAATKSQLQMDLAGLSAGPQDLFLFYYSGHGGQGGSVGSKGETKSSDSLDEWIFLHDSLSDFAPYVYWSETVNDDQLADLLTQIPSEKRIVIIDACNSGGFIGNQYEVDGIPSYYTGSKDGSLAALFEAIGLYTNFGAQDADIDPSLALVIGASGEREYSYESGSINHGVFTYFLLEAPLYGDNNGDGFVTVLETYKYVQQAIERYWNIGIDPEGKFLPHVSGGPVDYILFNAR